MAGLHYPRTVSGTQTIRRVVRMKQNAILLAIGCSFVGASVLLAADSLKKAKKVKKLSHDYVLLNKSVVEDLHSFKKSAVVWPTQAAINAKKADRSSKGVQQALQSTLQWLQTVLRSEFVPDESDVELIPLKSDVQGHDVVRLRYKTASYAVQIMSTSSGITVVIKDDDRKVHGKPIDVEQAKIYIRDCIDKFFNEADRIKSISLTNVQKKRNGIAGLPDVKPETCGYWWGLMSWWTDGQTVLFSTGKADGRAEEPNLKKEWFSEK